MIKIMLEHLGNLHQIRRSFRQDQYLFHRDDRVKSMFLIETGTAQLIRHHPNGSAVVLQRAIPDSILAEASLFTPKYHCDAIATSPVVARLISRTAMQQLFYTSHDFAKAWAVHLAGEVRDARLRAEILTLKTVAERLDAWLADNGHLPEKGSWKAIAQEIGTSPEALYREIARRK
ncbi:MAG: Crp/Fnr family transcriptional regulator [Aestuariivirga sp.]|nr:Crp/Fnr family transcriptional regulator [Aestuariivirga sp.]